MKPYPDDEEQDDYPEESLFLEDEVYDEPEFYIDHLGVLICSDDDPLSDAPAFDDELIDEYSDYPDSNFDECGLNDTDIGGDCDIQL